MKKMGNGGALSDVDAMKWRGSGLNIAASFCPLPIIPAKTPKAQERKFSNARIPDSAVWALLPEMT